MDCRTIDDGFYFAKGAEECDEYRTALDDLDDRTRAIFNLHHLSLHECIEGVWFDLRFPHSFEASEWVIEPFLCARTCFTPRMGPILKCPWHIATYGDNQHFPDAFLFKGDRVTIANTRLVNAGDDFENKSDTDQLLLFLKVRRSLGAEEMIDAPIVCNRRESLSRDCGRHQTIEKAVKRTERAQRVNPASLDAKNAYQFLTDVQIKRNEIVKRSISPISDLIDSIVGYAILAGLSLGRAERDETMRKPAQERLILKRKLAAAGKKGRARQASMFDYSKTRAIELAKELRRRDPGLSDEKLANMIIDRCAPGTMPDQIYLWKKWIPEFKKSGILPPANRPRSETKRAINLRLRRRGLS